METNNLLLTKDLSKKTGHGIGWNALGQVVQQAIRFVVIIILARLLNPKDFGIFAMVLVFTDFIQPFREWGFQAALIQKKDIDQEYQSTAFWSICSLSIVLYLISIISAPFVGSFFNSSLVAQIIPVLAVTFLLNPFGSVQWALFSRALDFRNIVFVSTIATLGYGITACAFAFNGMGVWSLVWATIIRELIVVAMFWFLHEWRPIFKFSIDKFKELWRFSFACTGTSVLNYGVNNFDNLMVGKLLGAAPLGFYNLAFNTVSQPQTRIVSQIVSVIFPVYSMIKDDVERMREAYLKTVKMVVAITIPVISILFVEARDFVFVFYGQKWLPAVLPIQIMCFYGLIRALAATASPVFLSKGRPDIEFKLTIFKLCVFILFISFGIHHGIVGVSFAVLFYAVIIFFPTFYFVEKLLDINAEKLYEIIFKYAILSSLIIGFLFLINSFLTRVDMTNPLLRLMMNAILGSCFYLVLWGIFSRSDYDAFVTIIKKAFL